MNAQLSALMDLAGSSAGLRQAPARDFFPEEPSAGGCPVAAGTVSGLHRAAGLDEAPEGVADRTGAATVEGLGDR